MPKSLSEGPTCCICLENYDQELARAFTASCGHSICAQCEFKLRIACMKKGIPSQCWICMKPFEGPLYRTYALESATPRTDVPRFSNPYLTNSQIRQQLTINPEIYKDITLPNYTPPEPDLPDPLPRQQQQPSSLHPLSMNIQRPLLIRPSNIQDSMYPPTYSGYFPNINQNRHHPYRPMTTNNFRINSMMPCYPSSQQQQQQYPSNSIRCPPPQFHQQQLQPPQFFSSYLDSLNSMQIPPTSASVIPPTPSGYSSQQQFVANQIWQHQQQQQQQQQSNNNNSNNYGNYHS